jgi:DNA-binding NtrC family response regulator
MAHLESLPTVSAKHCATVVIASADTCFRQRVKQVLEQLRWQVHQVAGGAEALLYLDDHDCEALILDSWLPDLEVNELISECRRRYPRTDLLTQDMGAPEMAAVKSWRRQELLYALRHGSDGGELRSERPHGLAKPDQRESRTADDTNLKITMPRSPSTAIAGGLQDKPDKFLRLPELLGSSPAILELCREIRLVAPRKATVLIEGPTGTGKELVARAIHRLSKRSSSPFIVLNCAAIPEALLEAELFGHTKGAFTGATQARLGRLEAANGGTLFLDEIGEMPLTLQPKLLRFLEQGELQRIGENEAVRVDVRVIAATHRQLEQRVRENNFRADLYFRLAVFPLTTPSLSERPEDIPELAEHFLRRLAIDQPVKGLHAAALQRLMGHPWPGGVRELEHVLERGYILAEERPEITTAELRFGSGRPLHTECT